MKTICLDFDGVCNTYDGWRGQDELFEPRPGLDVFLSWLVRHGYEVVIHSTRPAENIEMWLWQHSLDTYGIRVVDKKPAAVAYVDGRGIRFNGDFGEVIEALEARPYWELPPASPARRRRGARGSAQRR